MKITEDYKSFIKSELDKAGKSLGKMSDKETKAFFASIDKKWKANNEGKSDGATKKLGKKDTRSSWNKHMRDDKKTANKKSRQIGKQMTNEATNVRFDVDYYKNNSDRVQDFDEIIQAPTLKDAVAQATKKAKSKNMVHVEFYRKDWFLGSINARDAFKFKPGRDFRNLGADQMKGMKWESVNEAETMKGEDPCWDGYEMVGMKKKNGKEVPNCVPKNEATFSLNVDKEQLQEFNKLHGNVLSESNLRSVKVTYSNGDVITTSMAANLTDQQIKDYFKIGKSFNVGNGRGGDKMSTVKKVDIVK